MRTTALALLLLASSRFASADAALTTGAQPTMRGAHPTIRLENEVIRMVVHWDHVDADCAFVFANYGPACTVNMGFPDYALWPSRAVRTSVVENFTQYASYVNGKQVHTRLVLDKNQSEQWQTKLIAFPADGKLRVREVYTTKTGGIAATPLILAASYLLHTGASWKGAIGTATIMVTLDPDCDIPEPLNVQAFDPKTAAGGLALPWKVGNISVIGLDNPSVEGRTLMFVRQNWRPKANEDLVVLFAVSNKIRKEMGDAYREKMRKLGIKID